MIEAHGLDFAYGRAAPILSGWNMAFADGEVVAITGASGRGKSTLLYMLGLMLTPKSGSIAVDGRDTTAMSDFERSRLRANRFGFVFQDAALDPRRTVLENVVETELYRGGDLRQARDRARELLEAFGVGTRAGHKPGQISGGQAQRIALCRALITQPDFILADEPTGNLDVGTANVVIQALRAHARQGGLVIIATHDRNVVSACDRSIPL